MMRAACVAMIVLGCRRAEPIEKLEAPPAIPPLHAMVAPAERPPPPPPPPPPETKLIPAPPLIASFVAPHAQSAAPWRVTLLNLETKGSPRFMGYAIERRAVLPPAIANEFIERLGGEYVDGDVGCVGDPVGILVENGAAKLQLVEDCGHLYLSEQEHDGPFVVLTSEMAVYLRELRKTHRLL